MLKNINTIIIFASLSILLGISSCKSDEYQDWKIVNHNWLDANRTILLRDSGYTETQSGLIYKILEQGYQRFPNDNSIVYVKYTGRYVDNLVFDSGDSVSLALSNTVAGFREALKKIQDGGHIRMVIPYPIGYGTDASGSIPPYTVMIFDVKLYWSAY